MFPRPAPRTEAVPAWVDVPTSQVNPLPNQRQSGPPARLWKTFRSVLIHAKHSCQHADQFDDLSYYGKASPRQVNFQPAGQDGYHVNDGPVTASITEGLND